MALTDSQKTDVRRYAGYGAVADAPVGENADDAYVRTIQIWTTLAHRLDNLSGAEETVLTNVYLTNLNTLEAAIPAMSDDLDTNSAGTWVANPQEMSQRFSLFKRWCREMCAFLGVEPGPGLGTGGINIVRG